MRVRTLLSGTGVPQTGVPDRSSPGRSPPFRRDSPLAVGDSVNISVLCGRLRQRRHPPDDAHCRQPVRGLSARAARQRGGRSCDAGASARGSGGWTGGVTGRAGGSAGGRSSARDSFGTTSAAGSSAFVAGATGGGGVNDPMRARMIRWRRTSRALGRSGMSARAFTSAPASSAASGALRPSRGLVEVHARCRLGAVDAVAPLDHVRDRSRGCAPC